MRRDSTSPPRASVPRNYPGSAPASPAGGRDASIRSWSSGFFGAIHGANSAITISARIKPPPIVTLGSANKARTRRAARLGPGAARREEAEASVTGGRLFGRALKHGAVLD